MNSFNHLAYSEAELVSIIDDLDVQLKGLEHRISELTERMNERTEELKKVRARMKAYLENELSVNTQN